MASDTKQSYSKSDFLSYIDIAKKYNLDKDKTYQFMLNLYKKRIQFSYVSNNSQMYNIMVVTFSHSKTNGKMPLKLHPLAHEIFLKKYEQQPGKTEQLLAGEKAIKSALQANETTMATARKFNTKEK